MKKVLIVSTSGSQSPTFNFGVRVNTIFWEQDNIRNVSFDVDFAITSSKREIEKAIIDTIIAYAHDPNNSSHLDQTVWGTFSEKDILWFISVSLG